MNSLFQGLVLFLLLTIGYSLADDEVNKLQGADTSYVSSSRTGMLNLMFSKWAVNTEKTNGIGYLKEADGLSKQEAITVSQYYKDSSSSSTVKTQQEFINFTHDKVEKMIQSLRANKSLQDPEMLEKIKDEINKIYVRTGQVLKVRIGENPSYIEFMKQEELRDLGHTGRSNNPRALLTPELWNHAMNDSHTEMLIRMRMASEIAFDELNNFKKQVFGKRSGPVFFTDHHVPVVEEKGAQE